MRVTYPGVTIKQIWDAQTALYGIAGSYGILLETNLDGKVSLAKADLTTLETRLSAARATKLDNLDLAMTALRDAVILEVIDAFKISVTHMTGVTASGDFTNNPANVFDGNVYNDGNPTVVDQYAQLAFGALVTLRDFRMYGASLNTTDAGRWKISYQDILGAWVDLETGIPSTVGDAWSSWTEFSSQPEAKAIRITCTTYVVSSKRIGELQIRGVKGE